MKASIIIWPKAVNVPDGFHFKVLVLGAQELRILDLRNWPALVVKPLFAMFNLMYVLPLSNGQ